MERVLRQPCASLQEGELDDEREADDLGSESLDQARDRLDGAAGREDVVVDQDAVSLPHRLRMELESVLSVFERVRSPDGLGRQFARPACRDEAAADLARDRGAKDEPAGLRPEDYVRAQLLPPLRER